MAQLKTFILILFLLDIPLAWGRDSTTVPPPPSTMTAWRGAYILWQGGYRSDTFQAVVPRTCVAGYTPQLYCSIIATTQDTATAACTIRSINQFGGYPGTYGYPRLFVGSMSYSVTMFLSPMPTSGVVSYNPQGACVVRPFFFNCIIYCE